MAQTKTNEDFWDSLGLSNANKITLDTTEEDTEEIPAASLRNYSFPSGERMPEFKPPTAQKAERGVTSVREAIKGGQPFGSPAPFTNYFPPSVSDALSLAGVETKKDVYTLDDFYNDPKNHVYGEIIFEQLGIHADKDIGEFLRDEISFDDLTQRLYQVKKVFNKEGKAAYQALRENYTKASWKGSSVHRKAQSGWNYTTQIATDPVTLLSILVAPVTKGGSLLARIGGGEAARTAIKQVLLAGVRAGTKTKVLSETQRRSLSSTIGRTFAARAGPNIALSDKVLRSINPALVATGWKRTAVVGGLEGGLLMSGYDILSQNINIEMGQNIFGEDKNQYDPLQTIQYAALGTIFGSTVPAVVHMGSRAWNRVRPFNRLSEVASRYIGPNTAVGQSKLGDRFYGTVDGIRKYRDIVSGHTFGKLSTLLNPAARHSGSIKKIQGIFRYDAGETILSGLPTSRLERSMFEEALALSSLWEAKLQVILEPLKKGLPKRGFGLKEVPFTPARKRGHKFSLYRLDIKTSEMLASALRGSKKYGGKNIPKDILDAAKKMRRLFNLIHKEAKAAGLTPGKQKNYFPRLWADALETNVRLQKQFIREAIRSKQVKGLGNTPKERAADARRQAQELLDSMFEHTTDRFSMGTTQGYFVGRSLDKIDDRKLGELLNNNVEHVARDYIHRSAKLISEARTMGIDIPPLLISKDGQVVARVGKDVSRKDYLPPKLQKLYDKGVKELKAKGKSHLITNKLKKDLADNYRYATNQVEYWGPAGRITSESIQLIQAMATLPLATLTSITEAIIPLTKANAPQVIKGYSKTAIDQAHNFTYHVNKALDLDHLGWKISKPERIRAANEVGIALDSASMQRLETLFTSDIANPVLRALQRGYFRSILLVEWTKTVQLASYNVGKQVIIDNLERLATRKTRWGEYNIPDSTLDRYRGELFKLGIDINKGVRYINKQLKGKNLADFEREIEKGSARFAHEVILNPKGHAHVNKWLQNPKAAILFQLLPYPVAFGNTILKGFANKIMRGGPTDKARTAIAAMLMTNVALAANSLRSGGDMTFLRESDENKVWREGMRRWGAFGWLEWAHFYNRNYSWYGNFAAAAAKSIFGPFAGDIIDTVFQPYKGADRTFVKDFLVTNLPYWNALDTFGFELTLPSGRTISGKEVKRKILDWAAGKDEIIDEELKDLLADDSLKGFAKSRQGGERRGKKFEGGEVSEDYPVPFAKKNPSDRNDTMSPFNYTDQANRARLQLGGYPKGGHYTGPESVNNAMLLQIIKTRQTWLDKEIENLETLKPSGYHDQINKMSKEQENLWSQEDNITRYQRDTIANYQDWGKWVLGQAGWAKGAKYLNKLRGLRTKKATQVGPTGDIIDLEPGEEFWESAHNIIENEFPSRWNRQSVYTGETPLYPSIYAVGGAGGGGGSDIPPPIKPAPTDLVGGQYSQLERNIAQGQLKGTYPQLINAAINKGRVTDQELIDLGLHDIIAEKPTEKVTMEDLLTLVRERKPQLTRYTYIQEGGEPTDIKISRNQHTLNILSGGHSGIGNNLDFSKVERIQNAIKWDRSDKDFSKKATQAVQHVIDDILRSELTAGPASEGTTMETKPDWTAGEGSKNLLPLSDLSASMFNERPFNQPIETIEGQTLENSAYHISDVELHSFELDSRRSKPEYYTQMPAKKYKIQAITIASNEVADFYAPSRTIYDIYRVTEENGNEIITNITEPFFAVDEVGSEWGGEGRGSTIVSSLRDIVSDWREHGQGGEYIEWSKGKFTRQELELRLRTWLNEYELLSNSPEAFQEWQYPTSRTRGNTIEGVQYEGDGTLPNTREIEEAAKKDGDPNRKFYKEIVVFEDEGKSWITSGQTGEPSHSGFTEKPNEIGHAQVSERLSHIDGEEVSFIEALQGQLSQEIKSGAKTYRQSEQEIAAFDERIANVDSLIEGGKNYLQELKNVANYTVPEADDPRLEGLTADEYLKEMLRDPEAELSELHKGDIYFDLHNIEGTSGQVGLKVFEVGTHPNGVDLNLTGGNTSKGTLSYLEVLEEVMKSENMGGQVDLSAATKGGTENVIYYENRFVEYLNRNIPDLNLTGLPQEDMQSLIDKGYLNKTVQSLLEDQRPTGGYVLPDLPFKENWIDHVFKEVIDHELESGAKNIAWAPSYIQHWSWGEREMFPVLDAEMKKTAFRIAEEYGADVIDDEIFITFQYGNVNAKESILLGDYGVVSAQDALRQLPSDSILLESDIFRQSFSKNGGKLYELADAEGGRDWVEVAFSMDELDNHEFALLKDRINSHDNWAISIKVPSLRFSDAAREKWLREGFRTYKKEGGLVGQMDRLGLAEGGNPLMRIANLLGISEENIKKIDIDSAKYINNLVDSGLLDQREKVKINKKGSVEEAGDLYNIYHHALLGYREGDDFPKRIGMQAKEFLQYRGYLMDPDRPFESEGIDVNNAVDRYNNIIGFNLRKKYPNLQDEGKAIDELYDIVQQSRENLERGQITKGEDVIFTDEDYLKFADDPNIFEKIIRGGKAAVAAQKKSLQEVETLTPEDQMNRLGFAEGDGVEPYKDWEYYDYIPNLVEHLKGKGISVKTLPSELGKKWQDRTGYNVEPVFLPNSIDLSKVEGNVDAETFLNALNPNAKPRDYIKSIKLAKKYLNKAGNSTVYIPQNYYEGDDHDITRRLRRDITQTILASNIVNEAIQSPVKSLSKYTFRGEKGFRDPEKEKEYLASLGLNKYGSILEILDEGGEVPRSLLERADFDKGSSVESNMGWQYYEYAPDLIDHLAERGVEIVTVESDRAYVRPRFDLKRGTLKIHIPEEYVTAIDSQEESVDWYGQSRKLRKLIAEEIGRAGQLTDWESISKNPILERYGISQRGDIIGKHEPDQIENEEDVWRRIGYGDDYDKLLATLKEGGPQNDINVEPSLLQLQGVEPSLLQQQSFDQNQGIKLKPEDRELGPNDLGIWLDREAAEKMGYKYLDEETRKLYKYDPSTP